MCDETLRWCWDLVPLLLLLLLLLPLPSPLRRICSGAVLIWGEGEWRADISWVFMLITLTSYAQPDEFFSVLSKEPLLSLIGEHSQFQKNECLSGRSRKEDLYRPHLRSHIADRRLGKVVHNC